MPARPAPSAAIASIAADPRRRPPSAPVRAPRHTAASAPHTPHTQTRPVRAASPARHYEHLEWPTTFDDWMMDIVRRRALRLNSGARRRGVDGSVRAVELAHILDKSADAQGRWLCAICHGPVTLTDLSFDHVIALADGGEHAAHNLVPAHRKCNEIKGSEKAQYRAQALERWLSEWATSHSGATPKGAARYPVHTIAAREPARQYA